MHAQKRPSQGFAPKNPLRPLAGLLIGLSLSTLACTTAETETPTSRPSSADLPAATETSEARQVVLMHINDVYRIGGVDEGKAGGLSRVRALRKALEAEAPDLLFLHAGDLLFPSLLSRLYDGEQMIDVLNLMDGDSEAFDERMFAVFGNHEFDKDDDEDAAMLDARVEESDFYWLGSNIDFRPASEGQPGVDAEHLIDSRIVESGGVQVGLFGICTDMEHPKYIDAFRDPVEVSRQQVADLRARGAELVIGLTHLSLDEDIALLEALGDDGPDLVLGGHEHHKTTEPVAGRWILKADAEARSASVVRVTLKEGEAPDVQFEFPRLDAEAATDPDVDSAVAAWTRRHGKEFCGKEGLAADCLDEIYGRTNVKLVGEELELRRYETNLGNWVADRALEAFVDRGAQIAFINSGSLRLNQDVPAGADLTRRHVEEIFQFSSDLRLLSITGEILQQAAEHAVEGWSGEGKWMQVSGFAFRHDPETGTVDGLTLLAADGPRPVDPKEELLLVTGNYVASGRDGYTMLNTEMHLEVENPPVLRNLVVEKLKATRAEGIAPKVEGRICNTREPGDCLAVLPLK